MCAMAIERSKNEGKRKRLKKMRFRWAVESLIFTVAGGWLLRLLRRAESATRLIDEIVGAYSEEGAL